jgi:hypothetical protein
MAAVAARWPPAWPPRQVVDVAFALPYTPRAKTPGRLQVGLNVSGLLMNGRLCRRQRIWAGLRLCGI